MVSTDLTLRDVLLRCVDLYGSETAVVFGEEDISWSLLSRRVFKIANQLLVEGIARGDRVAVLQSNGPELVEIAFAVAILGAVLVPISPRLVLDEVVHVLHDSEPRVLFIEPNHLAAEGISGIHLLPTRGAAYAAFRDAGTEDEPPEVEQPDDVVLQLYTSGTTGRPKGVQHTHRSMIQHGLTVMVAQNLNHHDVFLSMTPLTHAASGTRIFGLAVDGLKHVIMEAFSVHGFFEVVARNRVTTTILVPTMLADIVDSTELKEADLSSLRFVMYGAAPTSQSLITRALERLPCGLFHGYGLTEGSPGLTALTPEEHRQYASDSNLRRRLQSIGRPVPGVRCRIVDADARSLASGVPGELHIRSTKTMVGYWGLPELTEAVFADGWLATGDIAETDENGFIYLIDRTKDMLISGGFNVYPSEIERVLREHEGVKDVAVVGAAHPRWGEVPVAFIVAHPSFDDKERGSLVDDLHSRCRELLADYKRPHEFQFMEVLPRNDTGKIDKKALRESADRQNTSDESIPIQDSESL
jgi:acyl-CoA synthetase (AMP-forming)/AMP-acid ligase II